MGQSHRARTTWLIVANLVLALAIRPVAAQGKNVRRIAQIGGGSRAVAVDDRYVYAAEGSNFHILDADTTAAAIARLGTIQLGDIIEDIQVAGALAFVAAGDVGIYVIAVADPAAPFLLGHYDTPGFASAVVVAANRLYVADTWPGLLIFDVGNPASPQLQGSVRMPYRPVGSWIGYAYDVSVVGSRAYVADGIGLVIVDVANAAAPSILYDYVYGYQRPYSIYVFSDRAYLCDYWGARSGVQIVDVSNPTSPVLQGRWSGYELPGGIVVTAGNLAYVANADRGLTILDISDPTSPTTRGAYQPPHCFYEDVVVTGTRVFVAATNDHIANDHPAIDVLSAANPDNPVLLASYGMTGIGAGVHVVNGVAYVAGAWNDLQIIDVSNPARPMRLGSYNNAGKVSKDVFVSGNRAYIADSGGGIEIVDIGNPQAPQLLGSLNYDACVASGTLAYCGSWRFAIVNVADPANPVVIGNLDGYGGKPFVVGNTVYLADGPNGLHILDISVPSSPQHRGTCDTSDSAVDVFVSGNLAYVADSYSGFQIIDVSDPTSPTRVATVDIPSRQGYGNRTFDVEVSNGRLYVADFLGLYVFGLADPVHPTLIGSLSLRYGKAVSVAGDFAYLADYFDGLVVAQYVGDAPHIQHATLADRNGNQLAEPDEQLILTMDRSVSITPDRIFANHFYFPVQSDDLGAAGFAVSANPYNTRQIVITLGLGVTLTPAGAFSMQSPAAGSPSGIDFAADMPEGLVVSVDGLSAADGGAPGVNDSGVDVQYSLLEREDGITTGGGAVAVVSSPDAAYTRHRLTVPAGALTATTRFRLASPPQDLGVIGAVQIRPSVPSLTFSTSATVQVEYREGDIDWERGRVEGEMQVHQLVEDTSGALAFVLVEGTQRLNGYQRTVSVPVSSLNPEGSVGSIGIFGGLPIETVDERVYNIKSSGGGAGGGAEQAGFVVTPGPEGAYTRHKIEIPGYQQAAPSDPARLIVTIRAARLAERVSQSSGQSFPAASGAVFVVTVTNAAMQPIAFLDPVHIAVQFKVREPWYLGDCIRFDGGPSLPRAMLVAYDALPGSEVDFEFVGDRRHVVDESARTVRVENITGLTGADGKGAWGAVANQYLSPVAHWHLYR